jgi:hypothetical protein
MDRVKVAHPLIASLGRLVRFLPFCSGSKATVRQPLIIKFPLTVAWLVLWVTSFAAAQECLPNAPEPSLVLLEPQPVTPRYAFTTSPVQVSAMSVTDEKFHWKGMLLQTLAFNGIQNGVRIATASTQNRHILVNKPFWHDYVASLRQFNMRRWNDGDSIKVNYIGHSLQGAITGFIEVQNSPKDRNLRFGASREYLNSRFRSFLWQTAYSTGWELLPIGEAGIFNEGGYTYPIQCEGAACQSPSAKYTNNTGWVDFVITPTLGTMLLVTEDYLDTVTGRLVQRHPDGKRYKLLRAGANPSRSVANLLRGRYPWYRDSEEEAHLESPVAVRFEHLVALEPKEHVDIFPHYTTMALRTNHLGCIGCKTTESGPGLSVGVRLTPYLDLDADFSVLADASPLSSAGIGGDLLLANMGLRSGFSSRFVALKFTLAPGIASYSRAQGLLTNSTLNPSEGRITNFQTTASISMDVKPTPHFAFRLTIDNRLIRYKSLESDTPGIGTPPNLSFLSHEYFINSTNWGLRVGPVFRF